MTEDADAREYEDFVHDQDPLDIEAATWVSRKRDGFSSASEAEWRRWLDADPRHQTAYDDMDETFGRLRDMPADEVESLRVALPAAPHLSENSSLWSPSRRAWLGTLVRWLPQAGMAATAASMAGGGWVGWQHWRSLPTFEHRYITARGQQLRADLPDGSHVDFDTSTQAEARLYRNRREVHLAEGQALFSVLADPQQPFHVFAGAIRVTVVGTRFSVRATRSGLAAGETRIVVEHGRVRVARSAGPADAAFAEGGKTVELTAGQAVTAAADGRLGAVLAVPPDSAALWREGRVSFDNTPLDLALAEFERYGSTNLVVRDPRVAALRVGGSFQLQHFEAFARSLPVQLPVRLERLRGVTEVVLVR